MTQATAEENPSTVESDDLGDGTIGTVTASTETATPETTGERRGAISTRLLTQAAAETDPVERKRLQDEVVVMHMGLARAIAARYRGRGIADEDLVQAASMALIKAARNFDPENGAEFLSYAVVTMKGEVKRQFRDFGWMVRPPRPIQKMQADVSRAESELTQTLGRSPRVPEVAATGVVRPAAPDQPDRALVVAAELRQRAGKVGASVTHAAGEPPQAGQEHDVREHDLAHEDPPPAFTIDTPPFYATKLYPLANKSAGGVAIDLATRALDADGAPVVTDGPFPETKEFLAGWWIVDVDSPERAYEIAADTSAAPGPDGKPMNMPMEVRQVMTGPPPQE